MPQNNNSSFVLPNAVHIISNDLQHILVNTDNLAWVKINDPLFRIVSHLNMPDCEEVIDQVIINNKVSKETIDKSLEFLNAQGILDKDIYKDKSDQSYHTLKNNNCGCINSPKRTTSTQSLSLLLDVTDKCNLKCPYCYAGSALAHTSTRADPTLKDISQIASALEQIHLFSITLSGGEPLLRTDIVDIITTVRDISKTQIYINTNGTLLTPAICIKIAPLLSGAMVSLDGSTAELHDSIAGVQGTYDKVINGIKNLQDAGLKRIEIISTMCRQNFDDLPNMIEIAKSLGVGFSTSFMVPTGCASLNSEALLISAEEESKLEELCWRKSLESDYPEYPKNTFYREYVRFARMRCPAFNSLYILTDGSIYPCPALRSQNEFYIGNALEHDDLNDLIETSPVITKLASFHVDQNPRYSECSACDVRYFCGGGCLGLELNSEDCSWKKERLRKRLWQYQDGLSLSENITAMFGRQPSQELSE